ncbi:predicted protein [Pyrenophora tritici-repentis Pt-1C-BFP]|uniref:Uncharacterized protein n=1 Tax=Pyrenophora tritici-repentis (strain Pt-1C-BFP) TaxID=426418 RepID=B2W2N1_PYRTR|nr:uncharacterized protein PTRG_03679 [Pyrenophora tritici-repentis Pt-1C-BFP]EDU46517.1 predicted protein [Pyrenophora tritici-repentis Pt-1C-BFP]
MQLLAGDFVRIAQLWRAGSASPVQDTSPDDLKRPPKGSALCSLSLMRPHRYRHIIPAKGSLAVQSVVRNALSTAAAVQQLSDRLMLLQSRRASKPYAVCRMALQKSRTSLKIAPGQQRPPMSLCSFRRRISTNVRPDSSGNTSGYTRFAQPEGTRGAICISLVLVLPSSFSNRASLAVDVARVWVAKKLER